MEQKKILWIVAAVSVFILVIFGFALVMNSPARNTEQGRQYASAFTPGSATSIGRENMAAGANSPGVDPDSWIKDPSKTPGLDTEIIPAANGANLTDLNNTEANAADSRLGATDTIDVRNLTGRTDTPATSSAMTADGTAVARRTETTNASQSAAQSTARAAENAGAKPSATTARPSSQGSAAAKTQETPKKAAAVTVTEYWIQTGSFTNKLNAENARKLLTDRYLNAEIFTKEAGGAQTYRVRVGPYADKTEAEYWLGTIKDAPEFSGSYISQVKAKR